MAIEPVKAYFKTLGMEEKVMELGTSSATVELAANALGVVPGRIAKTLSFKTDENAILVVTAGEAKIDNSKFKQAFGTKAKMLTPDEVIEKVGHAVGGVCPFAINENVPVYLDISMKRFDTIFPACGSSNSAIELTCGELFEYSKAIKWVDVCKNWE
jgi:prolyl-tRNA editing enzyme YbaK/EbsC (Cys-tRNA(Pro) deacylase)